MGSLIKLDLQRFHISPTIVFHPGRPVGLVRSAWGLGLIIVYEPEAVVFVKQEAVGGESIHTGAPGRHLDTKTSFNFLYSSPGNVYPSILKENSPRN